MLVERLKMPASLSRIDFSARTGKGVLVHLDEAALVDAHRLAALAPDLALTFFKTPDFVDTVTMAAQDLSLAKFSIAPQFCSTSCTFNNKHSGLFQFQIHANVSRRQGQCDAGYIQACPATFSKAGTNRAAAMEVEVPVSCVV